MSERTIIIIIVIVLVIIYVGPIIMDKILDNTTRKTRENKILTMMKQKQTKTQLPIVIFNRDKFVLIEPTGEIVEKDYSSGDILFILEGLKSGMIVGLFYLIEIVDQPDKLIAEAKKVSQGNLYVLGYEPNSLRSWHDTDIKRTMNNSFYTPKDVDNLRWSNISGVGKTFHKISGPAAEIAELVFV